MFIDDVQAWLAAGAGRSKGQAPDLDEAVVDGRMTAVWAALEELESRSRRVWAAAHDMWTRERVERWLGAFLGPFERGIAKRLPPEQRWAAVDVALAAEVRQTAVGDPRWSATVNRELQRLAEQASGSSGSGPSLRTDFGKWCVENALCTASGEATPLGRVLLELRGRDAVEFALAVGVELSVGREDPWRLGAAALEAIAENDQVFEEQSEQYNFTDDRFRREGMERLAAMGLAASTPPDEVDTFTAIHLHPDAVELVIRVAREPDSRFRALARTLLDLERGRVSVLAGARGGVDRSDLHYARSVAHEIRNLLLPLSTALASLWDELAQPTPDAERRQKLRDRIGRAMDRLGEFATEAVKLSAAVAEEEVAVVDVVADAVRATTAERNGRITVEVAVEAAARLTGSRRDWTSAFVNLLRNATQARATPGTVWVSAEPDTFGGLHLYVDDDGPGVPEELREQVFAQGHSTRGGTGLGLAEARRTALLAGGTLVCEASPRGGARFHFHLPARSGS